MIPPVMGGSTPSDGERDLFAKFRDDPDTRDWVVLHSLDIAKHRSQVSGEIDFVVLIPSQGVVCLEVKACRTLKVESGGWKYGQSGTWDMRGPFRQASEAMHSLRDQIVQARPELRNIVFWSAVAFTHMSFRMESAEWHRWQVLDQEFLKSRGLAAAVHAVLRNARRRLTETPSARWFDPNRQSPSPKEVGALVAVLRPNFESYESPRDRVARAAADAKKYTEEQYRALDFAEDNARVTFSGPAGTGKTLLALESARRAAESGHRTLFLCYNELLGKWLENEARSLGPAVEVDRIASRMLKVSGLNARDDRRFWDSELPRAALSAIRDDDGASFNSFDELIIDEAQDFLRGDYIDFLNCCVKGGLSRGRIKLFGDYERQSVYRAAELDLSELKDGWIPDLAVVRLRENCRNLPRVACLARDLGGLAPDYRKILRQDDEVDPTMIEFTSDTDQQRKLLDVLVELRAEGFALADIAVLSMTPENMCMIRARAAGAFVTNSGESPRSGGVFSSSVRRFKGLEASVVVVTDINDISSNEVQKLMYVAVTRTLGRLILLMNSQACREYKLLKSKQK
ncbi:nuclease-related domain-containing DEAD/DEAH box helicase [Reyranella sp. CPCC 100927]|uniref:nuclease-related domain-containing DEAD/DEAH box helicase n=1 Tax=Reyranella sp. CPCC 100927 TaxID=2599616 RepID=UPI0011B77B19|nr:NERD domain-containing protein/DEAD/DEAH box helicase [Reyranella sp. CPCC 100927]TWT06138.1 hypothetical protein FQU96_24150 [Reyranella sp. CPCC 100927]